MATESDMPQGVITREEALTVLNEIQNKINTMSNLDDRENYNRVLGQAFNKLYRADDLKGALIAVSGLINTAKQIAARENNDESVVAANQEISELASALKGRIKQIPDTPKFESAIEEVAKTEKVFRGEMIGLRNILTKVLQNRRISNDPALKGQLDKIIGSINGVLKEASFDELILKEKDGNYTINTAAFKVYLGKMESLINDTASLMDNKKDMAVIARVIPKDMANLDSLMIQSVQRVPRLPIIFNEITDEIEKNNKKNPTAPIVVNGLSDALTQAVAAGTHVNEAKRQREFIADNLQKLSTYNERRLGAGHKKEKAELASFIGGMKIDPAVNIGSYQIDLLNKLKQQLTDINKKKKPNQKQGKYTKLLEDMIGKISQDMTNAKTAELNKSIGKVAGEINSNDGKLDPAFIKENWTIFVNGDFSKGFMADIAPNLNDSQLFNFTQALMTAHLTSDNNTDSMLRANGHLSGMLYKELARRTGYDPLTNPGNAAPEQMKIMNDLVYKNIAHIQQHNADVVQKRGGAGMIVPTPEEYAKSVKTSAASAILFAFAPLEDLDKLQKYKDRSTPPKKDATDEMKEKFDMSVDEFIKDNVASVPSPQSPDNDVDAAISVESEVTESLITGDTESLGGDDDLSLSEPEVESYEQEVGEELEQAAEEQAVEEPEMDADQIVSALNKFKAAKQESDDPKAFLEGAEPSPEAAILKDFLADFKPHEKPEPSPEAVEEQQQDFSEDDDLDLDRIVKATKEYESRMSAEQSDSHAPKADQAQPESFAPSGKYQGRDIKAAIERGEGDVKMSHQEQQRAKLREERNAHLPQGRMLKDEIKAQAGNVTAPTARSDKMAERLAKIKERKDAAVAGKYDAKASTNPSNSQAKTAEPELDQDTPKRRGGPGQG